MHRLHRSVQLVVAMLVTAVAAAVTACTPATVPPAGLSCAWAYKTDPTALNVAYPDTGATYWTTTYNLVAGDSLVLKGTFPDARYMGFITYTVAGNVVDSLTDRDIAPDAGSDNPFADTAAAPGGTYTVEVAGTAPIGSPDNVVNPNGVLGSVIYRVYLGNGDPTGGVGLPQMLVKRTDGTVVPLPTCGNPGTDAGLVNLVNTFGPATDVPASDPPVFKRPTTVGGLYVNPDNGYVAAVVHTVATGWNGPIAVAVWPGATSNTDWVKSSAGSMWRISSRMSWAVEPQSSQATPSAVVALAGRSSGVDTTIV